MRKALLLAGLVGAVWAFLRRRRPQPPRVVVGYEDGSSITLPDGSPERDRLVAAARSLVDA